MCQVLPFRDRVELKAMTISGKAKVVMSYLSEQDSEIMDWPQQSPDLNPIENLWKTLGVKVIERNPTNTEDLWVKLHEEWLKISIEDYTLTYFKGFR